MIPYKIEQPDLSTISPERKVYLSENKYKIYFQYTLGQYSDEKYLYWDRIKFHDIPPELESHEELWYVIQSSRILRRTMIRDAGWEPFWLEKPNFLEELTHLLDYSLGGSFLGIHFTESERKIFLQNGIMEEAISSSQLEWALTTSKDARDMIAKWRRPTTVHEKMILNNYKAMNFVNNQEFLNQKMTRAGLLEIQNILTKDTLEEKNQEWRWRKDSDEIVIQNDTGTKIYHIPPNEKILQEELDRLISFANDEEKWFTHPFIKATLLHFWIGYLHPFCDGNGRTARAIFYWYLLKKWYWGLSYIPISQVIKDSKTQYLNAYLYSEQDQNNVTYFLVYIANKTKQAFKIFEEYVNKKKDKQKKIFTELSHLRLNERQNKLIAYFLENPRSYTNNSIHKNYYGIAIDTAKRDLEVLLQKWFLTKEKQWLYVNYFPIPNLSELI